MSERPRFRPPEIWHVTDKGIYQAMRRAASRAQERSIRRGVPCDISAEVLVQMVEDQSYRCALTGLPFRFVYEGDASRNPFAPSVDRIDPAQGYVRENCRLTLTMANVARGDFGDEHFYIMCAAAAAHRGPIDVTFADLFPERHLPIKGTRRRNISQNSDQSIKKSANDTNTL